METLRFPANIKVLVVHTRNVGIAAPAGFKSTFAKDL
jgi:hypothetical protein